MVVIGRIIEIGETQKGTTERGPWQRKTIVIRTIEQMPTEIAFTVKPSLIPSAELLVVGMLVNISFSVRSKKFQDRWFTDLTAWQITAQN